MRAGKKWWLSAEGIRGRIASASPIARFMGLWIIMKALSAISISSPAMAITEAHADAAIDAAVEDIEVGAIGAGTGMSCFGLKGGIGSASRRLRLDGETYHLGVLVLSKILFGGFRGHGGMHKRMHHHHLKNMTAEEREKSQAEMSSGCGSKHKQEESVPKE